MVAVIILWLTKEKKERKKIAAVTHSGGEDHWNIQTAVVTFYFTVALVAKHEGIINYRHLSKVGRLCTFVGTHTDAAEHAGWPGKRASSSVFAGKEHPLQN